MNPYFEITDKKQIYDLLDSVEYGTLAVSVDDVPYAVPLNFVRIEENIYFHGALQNKKMKILAHNPKASFCVVENYALIDSYFSTSEGLACPATQFFKSVSIDGVVEQLDNKEQKEQVLEALMKKLQPKGGYKALSDDAYTKVLKGTAVYRLIPSTLSCKFKFGQHLNEERFERIISHLEQRDKEIDRETIVMMRAQRGKANGV